MSDEVLSAWAGMKAAECEREVAMAAAAGMSGLAKPFERDAKFFREIERRLAKERANG